MELFEMNNVKGNYIESSNYKIHFIAIKQERKKNLGTILLL